MLNDAARVVLSTGQPEMRFGEGPEEASRPVSEFLAHCSTTEGRDAKQSKSQAIPETLRERLKQK